MKLPMTGGCQCGEIRYEIRAQPLTLYACHCTECQKQSSSAFGMSLSVPLQAFAVTRGTPQQWQRPADSGRTVDCYFCGTCGVRLYHAGSGGSDWLNVKPGTLDDIGWLRPVGHLWTRSAQGWVRFDDGTLVYAEQPDDMADLWRRWRDEYPDWGQPDPS